MKIAYIAGPYRAKSIYNVVQNIRKAEHVSVALWRMGIPNICPHKNTALLDGCIGGEGFGDASVWIDGDLEMLRRCDLVVMFPGWEGSEGARAERQCAINNNIPVFEWADSFHREELCVIGVSNG